jgi:hypothetical protein
MDRTKPTLSKRAHTPWIFAIASLVCVAAAVDAQAPPSPDIDPDADRILRAMARYVGGLQHLRIRTENTIEVVTEEGQKVQFIVPATVTLSRPNKLFAERKGDIVDQAFYYDGKSLTLYNPDTQHFATVPAPDTIDAALDFARDTLDIVAPGGDLIDTRAYDKLMEDATSGDYLGISVVGGHRCHHLAYRATLVDWELWVREGDRPIPCKYVITSKDIAGAPEFTVSIDEWDSAPKIAPGLFTFKPPADAMSVEFLPIAGATP